MFVLYSSITMEARLSLLFCLLFLSSAFAQITLASPQQPVYPAIFAFGDSFTDTGNLLISQNYSVDQIENYLPYGSTFFHKPTGRFSDGRLVVDFLAQRLRAPLLKPFLLPRSQSGSLAFEDRFVSFAVGGATAQSAVLLKKTLNISSITPFSLDVQLERLEQLLGEIKEVHLPEALIFFGEIGHNDYSYAIISGKPHAEVLSSVPNVITQIKRLLQKLIKDGAKYIVVQGNLPMGCDPLFRRMLNSSPKDKFGCIQSINKMSHKHNKQLQKVLRYLIRKYPDVSIAYFDFEKAYIQVLKRPSVFGFTNTTSPCYDILMVASVPFNITAFQEVKACPHPSKYLNWDGVHLTEAMDKTLTNLFFDEGFVDPYPNFLTKRLG